MQIFVDADACPVVGIIETMAEKYNIPITLLCYTNPSDTGYLQGCGQLSDRGL